MLLSSRKPLIISPFFVTKFWYGKGLSRSLRQHALKCNICSNYRYKPYFRGAGPMANQPPPHLPTLPHMPIGVLARESGCKVETIRYYERIGILPEPPRNSGGQRRYHAWHLKRLNFVRRARDLGFT